MDVVVERPFDSKRLLVEEMHSDAGLSVEEGAVRGRKRGYKEQSLIWDSGGRLDWIRRAVVSEIGPKYGGR
ncbi:hypothetical protein ACH5RR_018423 [Cinchona calisaya]|uniref:Uncharacterized protein n=1 Tax=Cinchona calisaya TaxID=153742 RepID=A0ABD2ZLD8_9GENT